MTPIKLSMTVPGPYRASGALGWISGVIAFDAWADRMGSLGPHQVNLLENDLSIGPGHAIHEQIRVNGGGRYSLWNNGTATILCFSTSDGSDPNVNGRKYTLSTEVDAKDLFIESKSHLSDVYIPPEFSELSPSRQQEVIDNFFESVADARHAGRDRFYHAEEYLLGRLVQYLGRVQGGSVRHVNIADQYVRVAQRYLPSMSDTVVAEIGPGNHLGTGIIFRYLGSIQYIGIELYTGPDFNSFSTLSTVEILTRFKYGHFLDNFSNVPLGFTPRTRIDHGVDLGTSGIRLLKQESFSKIDLPPSSVDYIFSNFVFEHIQSPEKMLGQIARALRPGGLTAHFIDIEDHSNFNKPHAYLTYSDEDWATRFAHAGGPVPSHLYENRYRASDFRRAFERAGLNIVEFTPLRSHTLTPAEIAAFDKKWQRYEKSDLEIVWLFVVARKC